MIDPGKIELVKKPKGLIKNVSFKDQQLPPPPIKRNSYQDTVIKFIEQQTEEKSTEKSILERKWSNQRRSAISGTAEDEFCTYNTEYYV